MKSVVVTFEMQDGRELTCKYSYHVTPGNTTGLPENCYPDEAEVSDPTFYIDGVETPWGQLPPGLNTLAEDMYTFGDFDKRFKYKESEVECEPDFAGPTDLDDFIRGDYF